MSIVRKARRLRFTQLDNALIEDQEIGFPALGVLAYLLSKPDHWTVSCGDLQRRGGIGRDALRSIMGQLQAAGYASLATAHGDGTRVAGTRWEVSEDKAPRDGFSDGRNPRRSENPPP